MYGSSFFSLEIEAMAMRSVIKLFLSFLEFRDKIELKVNTILVRGVTNDSGIRRTEVVQRV